LAWNMERVWSMVGLWLCCGRKHMVLVGNDNDKNAGCSGGSGVVTTLIGSDFTVVTKDSQLLKIFSFRDSKECLGFYSKVLS